MLVNFNDVIHFEPYEFISIHDEDASIKDAYKMDKLLIETIDFIRGKIGRPLIINSGYRSKAYNKRVGGKKNSQHTQYKAVDIAIDNQIMGDEIEALFIERVGPRCGIGRYVTSENGGGFIHLDTRDFFARWNNAAYRDWLRNQ